MAESRSVLLVSSIKVSIDNSYLDGPGLGLGPEGGAGRHRKYK